MSFSAAKSQNDCNFHEVDEKHCFQCLEYFLECFVPKTSSGMNSSCPEVINILEGLAKFFVFQTVVDNEARYSQVRSWSRTGNRLSPLQLPVRNFWVQVFSAWNCIVVYTPVFWGIMSEIESVSGNHGKEILLQNDLNVSPVRAPSWKIEDFKALFRKQRSRPLTPQGTSKTGRQF